jgi:hypothetical protein
MQILERFFDFKVACPPYKVNPLTAFGRLMMAPLRVLKDCVQIMRLELVSRLCSFSCSLSSVDQYLVDSGETGFDSFFF